MTYGPAKMDVFVGWSWTFALLSIAKICAALIAVVTVIGVVFKNFIRKQLFAYLMTYITPSYNDRMNNRKRRLFAGLEEMKAQRGDGKLTIVEIGCGPGANFKYYPEGCEVICVDPNRYFESYLRKSSRLWPGVKVSEFHVATAENMRDVLETGVADAVVCTLVLCSVQDVDESLREIHRILKPGGKFFFLEHVLSPVTYPYARRAQRMFAGLWAFLFVDCHLTRTSQDNIRAAQFHQLHLEEFEAMELTEPTYYFFAARLVRPHVCGVAVK